MRMFGTLVIMAAAVAAAAAAAAAAQPARLTDAAYVKAARCVGLASSPNLGAGDASAMKSWLDVQGRGREAFIQDMADKARVNAQSEARRANDGSKAKLAAELAGPCAALKS